MGILVSLAQRIEAASWHHSFLEASMVWRPSQDLSLNRHEPNELWPALRSLYDEAIKMDPLPRHDEQSLDLAYITDRRGHDANALKAMLGQVPPSMRGMRLGITEIELLSLLLSSSGTRYIVLFGPRGAGKTSLLHYVESVCLRSPLPSPPTIIKFNGLELGDREPEFEIVKAFKTSLVNHRRPDDPVLSELVSVSLNAVKRARTLGTVRNAMATAFESVSKKDRRRIVYAFDNLDQLEPDTQSMVLSLAKMISIACEVAVVVSLRPQSLEGQVRHGNPGAFYQFRLDVPAPRISAWLDQLASRLQRKAEEENLASGWEAIIGGVSLSPSRISEIAQRFRALLLQSRREQNAVLPILQTVAADDTRKLALLVRRLFASRSLPAGLLIDNASPIEETRFHAISALIEGEHTVFSDSLLIPNLLWMDCTEDSPKALIFQRILQLLGGSQQVTTKQLMLHLSLLGYSEAQCDQAISKLTSTLLMRSTDVEKYSPSRRPTALSLTEAGRYFRDSLLCNPDYLLAAVMDLPLEHLDLRSSQRRAASEDFRNVEFTSNLSSLVEYIAEVRRKEANQVFRLLRKQGTPELRRVAFTLRRGGLLLSALRVAVRDLMERGRHSVSSRVKDAVAGLQATLDDLDQVISTLESKLDEAENKSREDLTFMPADESRRVGDIDFGISMSPDAEGLNCRLSINAETDRSVLLIGVVPQNGELSVPQGTVANRPLDATDDAAATQRVVLNPAQVNLPAGSVAVRVQGLALSERLASRVGLISPALIDGKFALQLRTPTQNGRRYEMHEIGKPLPISEIVNIGRSVRDQVSAAPAARFHEQLLIQGTRLANEVLTPEGRNALSSLYRSIDTAVLLVSDIGLDVPWEWLRPTPLHQDVDLRRLLCQQWRVIRWPASPVDVVLRLQEAALDRTSRSLATFGLNGSAQWRRPVPASLAQLGTETNSFDTIHLVGHYDQNDELVMGKGADRLTFGVAAARAIPFLARRKCVVLSGCNLGAAPLTTNLAIALTHDYDCTVWTPIVEIDERDADAIDQRLHQAMSDDQHQCVDRFFQEENLSNGWTNVYVRYGFGANTDLQESTT